MNNIHHLPPPSNTWRDRLIVDKRGTAKPVFVNAAHALREAPAWHDVLAFDEFAKRTMMMQPPPWDNVPTAFEARPWTTQDDLQTTEWLQQQNILVTISVTERAIEMVSTERRYHPVLEYLSSLEWDGVPRLDLWMIVHLGAENNDYNKMVARCTLIGAVARVSDPGCKVDNMPIFEGLQGIGKSSMAQALFEPWFSDEIADLGSKDAAMQAQGIWAIEIAELDAMSRGEVSKIKAFTSRRTDRFRPPYGHRVIEYPRQCVFWGTTNSSGYLKDETGARRSWPVKCGKLDLAGLRAARDQLWAEAGQMYLADVKWWITDSKVLKAAEAEQAERYQGDPWDDLIAQYVASRSSVTIHELLTDAVFKHTDQQSHTDQLRAVRILQHLKWERFQQRNGNDRQWRYRRSIRASDQVELSEKEVAMVRRVGHFIRAWRELAEFSSILA